MNFVEANRAKQSKIFGVNKRARWVRLKQVRTGSEIVSQLCKRSRAMPLKASWFLSSLLSEKLH